MMITVHVEPHGSLALSPFLLFSFSPFLLFSFTPFLLFFFSPSLLGFLLPVFLITRHSRIGIRAVVPLQSLPRLAAVFMPLISFPLMGCLSHSLSPMLTSYHQTTNPPLMPGIRLMMTGYARTPLCPISIRSLWCTLHARWPSKSPLLFIHMPMLHHNLTRVEFSFLIMPTFARPLLLTRRLTRITPAKVIEMPECIRG